MKTMLIILVVVVLLLTGCTDGEMSRSDALRECYRQAKDCSQGYPSVENHLKIECLNVYQNSNTNDDLLLFASGLELSCGKQSPAYQNKNI